MDGADAAVDAAVARPRKRLQLRQRRRLLQLGTSSRDQRIVQLSRREARHPQRPLVARSLSWLRFR